jgi:hypothetical protein
MPFTGSFVGPILSNPSNRISCPQIQIYKMMDGFCLGGQVSANNPIQ